MTTPFDVSFLKYVNVSENVDIDKSIDVRAYVSGNSAIVAESSVTGNMRPSGSVLSRTPCASNHATVSLGENRWNGEISARSPRG